VDSKAVAELMTNSSASHLVEAVLAAASPQLLSEFFSRFLRGRLADLTWHPSANFVVQVGWLPTSSMLCRLCNVMSIYAKNLVWFRACVTRSLHKPYLSMPYLQAALAAMSQPQLVKQAVIELETHMQDMLRRRRSGVLVALVAACGRCRAAQALAPNSCGGTVQACVCGLLCRQMCANAIKTTWTPLAALPLQSKTAAIEAWHVCLPMLLLAVL
jgi:hypothetical protein